MVLGKVCLMTKLSTKEASAPCTAISSLSFVTSVSSVNFTSETSKQEGTGPWLVSSAAGSQKKWNLLYFGLRMYILLDSGHLLVHLWSI